MATNRDHPRYRGSVRFVLYDPRGPEVGIYGSAIDCANATVEHPRVEGLMVRGVGANGEQIFRETALDFGMTVYD